jgi:NTE family protein
MKTAITTLSQTHVPVTRSGVGPRIGLALGGGGARGLAHILVLEALDELGLVPHRIAGTSIGAIYGAAYASGLPAKLVRAHTEEVLGDRVDLARQIFASRSAPVSKWLSVLPIRTSLLDPVRLLDVLLPSKVARDFSTLKIPLQVVATDFYAQEQAVFSSGPLRPAVAASMALPAIFTPVQVNGRALVDGGLVNPLPFDLVTDDTDITIAIDVSGAPSQNGNGQPGAVEVLLASSQIFQRSIVREKLKSTRPDIYIDCPVDQFTVLDFHRFKEILEASAPVKDQLKRQLELVLTSHTAELEMLEAQVPEPVSGSSPRKRAAASLARAKAMLPTSRRSKRKPSG